MMSTIQSLTFRHAVRACSEQMNEGLASLLRQHGCLFWIALMAVVGDDLWQLRNRAGCMPADVDWILKRLGSENSTTPIRLRQRTESLVETMADLTNSLSDEEYGSRIHSAEREIRALEANLGQNHGLLVTGTTLVDFLQPALAQMVAEGFQDIARDLCGSIRAAAFALECRKPLGCAEI